jgi:hypothetical protein
MKRNMIPYILIVLITISFLSLTGCNNLYLMEEQPPVPAETQKIDSSLQEICKNRCDEYFSQRHLAGYSYQSHYNNKLNKCFLLTEDASKTSKDLYDIDESRHLGMFFHDPDGIYCNLLETECRSEKEWNSLITPYMKD